MFEFDTHLDAIGAARAERLFLLRSMRTFPIRIISTFVAPPFLALAALAGYYFDFGAFFVGFFALICALSIFFPLFMFFARPAAMARFAEKHPISHIRVAPEAITVETNAQPATLPWDRISAIWDSPDHVSLVINPFAAVHLPKAGMPAGVEQFMRKAIHRAA